MLSYGFKYDQIKTYSNQHGYTISKDDVSILMLAFAYFSITNKRKLLNYVICFASTHRADLKINQASELVCDKYCDMLQKTPTQIKVLSFNIN